MLICKEYRNGGVTIIALERHVVAYLGIVKNDKEPELFRKVVVRKPILCQVIVIAPVDFAGVVLGLTTARGTKDKGFGRRERKRCVHQLGGSLCRQ